LHQVVSNAPKAAPRGGFHFAKIEQKAYAQCTSSGPAGARTWGGKMSVLTLDDVRARDEVIRMGRQGQTITRAALTRRFGKNAATALVSEMMASSEIFEVGDHLLVHPSILDDSTPLGFISAQHTA
jgi:hypothetical protein